MVSGPWWVALSEIEYFEMRLKEAGISDKEIKRIKQKVMLDGTLNTKKYDLNVKFRVPHRTKED